MKTSFTKIHQERKIFQNTNKNTDHIITLGNNNILLSAPHGVSQVRLGKYKHSEIGSIATALFLQNQTNCNLIAKTQNNNDDANFDEQSKYKDTIKKLIKNNNIKYLIDIHGLAENRDCDINLGTHLGKNIITNNEIFNELLKILNENNFKVSIDQPYMAGSHTLSGSINQEFNIWTLQIEINCAITNKKENFSKYKSLLYCLKEWIKKIK